jgi:hypothetical protein|tara:strand:+ start:228 stop:458 length:231 start_codon:yes stop_codon:yes gene_type:complete
VSNKDNNKLQEAFNDLYKHTLMLGLQYNWEIIAATLITIGLRLYKTVLNDEDYDSMMRTIVKSIPEIQKFEDTTLH